MKSQGKTLFLSSVLSAIALACTLANAAPKNDAAFADNKIQQQNYMLFIPQLESEGRNQLAITSQKIAYSYEKSLLPSLSAKKVEHKSCKTKKKNEIYELSAIFNDRLQLFLSYIDSTQTYKNSDKKNTDNDLNVSNNVRVH
ncbi:MAG: hypothetical protein KC484_13500 [Colwelliaceae bacterium]|jgi:hypothetical protein|nr:hypothetical protein [Colwelliaceae bacterium]